MSATPHPENPFAGQGAVLLDIGGDVGALVVTMPAAMVDVEVEIRAAGPAGPAAPGHDHGHDHGRDHGHDHGHGSHRGGHHPHVAVVERPVVGGVVPSLVFPELDAGSYALQVKDTTEARMLVEVVGGQVTTATWPG